MNLLSRDDLGTLLEKRPGWHVSMFMPMIQRGAETQQNSIRCKTLLRQAEEQLLANGLRPQEAQDLVQPVQQLLPNRDFWQRQSHGLSIFMAPQIFRAYRVPLALEELVVVAHRFHIKPLLPLLSGDGHFFVLALSQKAVRLLQGTRFSINEVELQGVPQGVAEALRYEDVEKKGHHYPGSQGRPAGGVSPLAGHGVGIEDATHEPHDPILRYFHQVDTGLRAFLRAEHAPLVLAGVEYLLPIYRRANTYPYLLEEGVTGNPDGLRSEELQERAWAIVRPYFHQAQEGAAAQDRGPALRALRSLVPLSEAETDEVFMRVADTIYATVYGTLVVALVQGLLGGLMFWILGVPSALLWGTVMALLAVVPVLGAFIVWVPAALFLALAGNWGKAIILTAWGAGVVSLIDNLLYPILVGKRLRLHTLPVFIAIVGGILLFGSAGLILGPVTLAVTVALVDVWHRRTG